jgi:hypothetical protein
MSWNRRLGKVRWINPNAVFAAVMVQLASMLAEMTFQ